MKPVFIGLIVGAIGCVQPLAAMGAGKFQETILYSFCTKQNCPDGWDPYGGLIDVNGTLYGTTYVGGGTGCGGAGCGTIFSLDPGTGTETVLHAFTGGTDGEFPIAGLIDVNGTLYGTTQQGGNSNSACYANGCGTVFAVDPTTGKESVLYSFCGQQGCADGANPFAGLTNVKGVLYGTTQTGGGSGCGGSGCGTVFSIDPGTGAETLLHSFAGGTDGAYPSAGLIAVKGALYGTTFEGGTTGSGTVFAVSADKGTETVLHSFDCCGGTDGGYPLASLIDVKGTLYGTTYSGGLQNCTGGQGCGTVFSMTTSGTEKIVYAFHGGKDGQGPEAGLVSMNGALYGTTGGHGTNGANAGTAFVLNAKTGKEKVIHAFAGDPDGALPTANLLAVNGTLYGTTQTGGTGQCGTGGGCGSVFALTATSGEKP